MFRFFSSTSYLHCAVSFARVGKHNIFSSHEVTMIKQLTHHLNLALLNARAFQEIETRQMLFQETMEHLDTGIILSDAYNTVYYMNDTAEEILAEESRTSMNVSTVLEKFKLNAAEAIESESQESVANIAYYRQGTSRPVSLELKTVKFSQSSRFLVTFLIQSRDEQKNRFGDSEELLTAKEREVLNYLCNGLQYKEIASEMEISINTVNFHIKNIYRKMNVSSKTEVLKKAILVNGSGINYLPETVV